MTTDRYFLETMREVWVEGGKEVVEIGPDRDGVDCVEIRYKLDDGTIGSKMMFPPEMARLVANAMLASADEVERAGGQ